MLLVTRCCTFGPRQYLDHCGVSLACTGPTNRCCTHLRYAGPYGAYYVGELTGVPFAVGAARVYRVVPGKAPQVFLEGFAVIID